MKRLLILAPSLVLIAACSRGPDRIQNGQWEMEVVLTSIDMPGAPPEQQAAARAQLNQPHPQRMCITADQAANPLRQLREGMTRGVNCQTSDDTFAGGVIKIGVNCRPQSGPGQMRMSMNGSFTATTLQSDMQMNIEGPTPTGGTQNVRTAATIRGHRVGECAAGAAPAGAIPGMPG